MQPWTRSSLDLEALSIAPPAARDPTTTAAWRARLLAHLRDGPGIARVQLSTDLSVEEAKTEVEWLCGLIGTFVPQSTRRERVFSITNEGGQRGKVDTRGARSGGALDWHTDSAPNWQGVTPDIVGLYGYSTSADGGDTTFACARTVVDYMRRGFPELVDELYREMAFDQRTEAAPGQATVHRASVLREHLERTTVRFAPVYIFRGHELIGEALTSNQALAVLSLCSCAYHAENHVALRLQAGELVLFNNRELIHGRTAFDDRGAPRPRHLFRIWMVVDDPAFPRP